MIFRDTWEQVLDGTKTQTRRLRKDGDRLVEGWGMPAGVYRNGRQKWKVGRKYAIQPKRGQNNVGYFTLKAIRGEKLQEITEADAIAEGIEKVTVPSIWYLGEALFAFERLWNSIHKKTGERWKDNPEVWVLTMESVKA